MILTCSWWSLIEGHIERLERVNLDFVGKKQKDVGCKTTHIVAFDTHINRPSSNFTLRNII